MADIELVTCALIDADQKVWLMERKDHRQLQMPGGRMLFGEDPTEATARHVQQDLNTIVRQQRYLGKTSFWQGGVEYDCAWWQATEIENEPILGDGVKYGVAEYYDLYKYRINQSDLSPNVRNFVRGLQNGDFRLLPTRLVQ